jgi:hypothetical protein
MLEFRTREEKDAMKRKRKLARGMRKGVDNSRLQGSEYGGSLSNEEANAAKSGKTKLGNNVNTIAKQVAMTGASMGMAAAMPSIIATGKGVQAASAANKAARAAGTLASGSAGTGMLAAGTNATVGVGAPVAAQKGSNFLQGVKKAKEVVDTVGQVVDTVGQVVDTGKQVAQMFQQPEPTTGMNQIAPQQQVGFSPEVYQQYGMNMNYGFNPKSAPAVTPSGPAYLSSIYNPVGNI